MEFRPSGRTACREVESQALPALQNLEMVAGGASPRWLMGVVVAALGATEVGEEWRQRHLSEVLRDWSFRFTQPGSR